MNLARKREDLNYGLLGIKLWIREKVHVADLFGVMMVVMLGVNCPVSGYAGHWGGFYMVDETGCERKEK